MSRYTSPYCYAGFERGIYNGHITTKVLRDWIYACSSDERR